MKKNQIYPNKVGDALPLIAIALLLILPGLTGPYTVHLLTMAVALSIFALGYDLLLGHTGIVSFGHSVLFGLSAYAFGVMSISVFHVGSPVVLVLATIVTGVALGAAMGLICSYSRGIYLAILTFAIAHIAELFVLTDPGGITFGENGIVGVRPSFDMTMLSINLFAGTGLYYCSLGLLCVTIVFLHHLYRSQWGEVLHAIRENEQRLSSLGYNTRLYKIGAFAISGGLAGMSGFIVASLNNIVSPAMVDWQVGAEVLLVAVLGGAGTKSGPIIGAFAVVFIEAFATSLVGGGNWVYVLGAMYVVVALFLPGGIVARYPEIKQFVCNYIIPSDARPSGNRGP